MMRPLMPRGRSKGFLLIEALVGMLIFSIGVLGLVGLQSAAIRTTVDAKGRSDAAFLTNQLIARMWTDRTNLASYQLNAAGSACEAASAANSTSYAPLVNWLRYVQGEGADAGLLPSASALRQQISVGANNEVTVTLCWKSSNGEAHRHVTRAQVRFN